MHAPERFEQLIAFLSTNLPTPTEQEETGDGGRIFTGGNPPEVVVHLTQSSVIVAAYAGAWESPYSFVVTPRRVGAVKWRRLPETPLMNALAQLIQGAREARRATYRMCQSCELAKPPELMGDADQCVDCAGRESQVVH